MRRSRSLTTGLVFCTTLGALYVASLVGLGMENAPPVLVTITGGALGLVTLAGTTLAWRGSPQRCTHRIGALALAALLWSGAFVDDTPPAGAFTIAGAAIAAALTGAELLAAALRQLPAGVSEQA